MDKKTVPMNEELLKNCLEMAVRATLVYLTDNIDGFTELMDYRLEEKGDNLPEFIDEIVHGSLLTMAAAVIKASEQNDG